MVTSYGFYRGRVIIKTGGTVGADDSDESFGLEGIIGKVRKTMARVRKRSTS